MSASPRINRLATVSKLAPRKTPALKKRVTTTPLNAGLAKRLDRAVALTRLLEEDLMRVGLHYVLDRIERDGSLILPLTFNPAAS